MNKSCQSKDIANFGVWLEQCDTYANDVAEEDRENGPRKSHKESSDEADSQIWVLRLIQFVDTLHGRSI